MYKVHFQCVRKFVKLSVCVRMSVRMFVSLSVCLSVCLYVCQFVCMLVSVSVCLSVCLSECPYVFHTTRADAAVRVVVSPSLCITLLCSLDELFLTYSSVSRQSSCVYRARMNQIMTIAKLTFNFATLF